MKIKKKIRLIGLSFIICILAVINPNQAFALEEEDPVVSGDRSVGEDIVEDTSKEEIIILEDFSDSEDENIEDILSLSPVEVSGPLKGANEEEDKQGLLKEEEADKEVEAYQPVDLNETDGNINDDIKEDLPEEEKEDLKVQPPLEVKVDQEESGNEENPSQPANINPSGQDPSVGESPTSPNISANNDKSYQNQDTYNKDPDPFDNEVKTYLDDQKKETLVLEVGSSQDRDNPDRFDFLSRRKKIDDSPNAERIYVHLIGVFFLTITLVVLLKVFKNKDRI
ncbi:MAG: hypothetical protein Q4D88_03785 [Anaerococcus sp.]|nr:hypothetical protein [Anaerococcus sp.]